MSTSALTGKDRRNAGSPYINNSQQAVLSVLEQLIDWPLDAFSVPTMMKQVGLPRDQVFRALENLRHAGWAEKTGNGHHRISPSATRLFERGRLALQDWHREHLAT